MSYFLAALQPPTVAVLEFMWWVIHHTVH